MIRFVLALVMALAVSSQSFAAVKWSNEGNKVRQQADEVWSRLSDAEICQKLKEMSDKSGTWKLLKAEKNRRHIKC